MRYRVRNVADGQFVEITTMFHSEAAMVEHHKIEKTPLEAKQGIELFRIRWVLIVSMALVIVGMVAAFLIFGRW